MFLESWLCDFRAQSVITDGVIHKLAAIAFAFAACPLGDHRIEFRHR